MSTLQDGATLARTDTNDTDSTAYRVTDPEMTRHANAALLVLFNRAPHLWHGQYDATPNNLAVLGDPFPLEPQWLRVFADLIVALIETKDDEFTLSQRVGAIMDRAFALATG